MTDKKFIYKLGGADKMIVAIILATLLVFGLIVASDKYYFTNETSRVITPSNDIQELEKQREELRREIEKFIEDNPEYQS